MDFIKPPRIPSGSIASLFIYYLPGIRYGKELEGMKVLVGFGHQSVLGVADKIVAGEKDKSIRSERPKMA